MAHDSRAVANYMLDLAADKKYLHITPMQILKLVYIAHGWNLGILNEPLIIDHVEAWQYGPVIPNLYRAFKKFGGNPITEKAKSLVFREISSEFTENEATVIEQVFIEYGQKSGIELSALTHKTDTPWYKIWFELGGNNTFHAVIPNDFIQDYYKKLAN
jgi:uncharacterized phage-associated protein